MTPDAQHPGSSGVGPQTGPLAAAERLKRASRWTALTLYGVVVLVLLLGVLPGLLEAVFRDFRKDLDQDLPSRARSHYGYIRSHLRAPFDGYSGHQVFTRQFQVVVLSHMACGLMNAVLADPELKAEVPPLLRELVSRATSKHVAPYGAPPAEVRDLGDHGLYLSHLNLVLGCHRQVSGSGEFDALHERVARHLAGLCLRDGDSHAHSWPGSPKWPADQTVALCSLYLYDKTRGTNLSREPIRGWLAYMKDAATDPASGLHRSSISALPYAHQPRGCAMSWSLLYMAQFAPGEAARLYDLYRGAYRRDVLGCTGFREWPPGYAGGSDVDSGPIVFGAGAAATGLGIGPARLFRDYGTYEGLMRSASTVGLPSIVGRHRKYRLSPLLGEAILFHGETARVWFAKPPATVYPRSRLFPTGPLLLLGLILALLLLIAWRMKRLIRLQRTGVPAGRGGTA